MVDLIEKWLPIKGYKDYHISSLGRIKSFKRNYTRILKNDNYQIYTRINLLKDGKAKRFLVHRLVAIAFLDNPNTFAEINHRNGIKNDNRLENLEWCSRKQNMDHAIKTGLFNEFGEKGHLAKITWDDARQIRSIYKQGQLSMRKLGSAFGLSIKPIWDIIHNKTWKEQYANK